MSDESQNQVDEKLEGLTLTISDTLTGYEVEIAGYKRIKEFFEKERDFWQKWEKGNDQTARIWVRSVTEIVDRLERYPEVLQSDVVQANRHWNSIIEGVQTLLHNEPQNNLWRYFYSKSAEGQFIAELLQRGQEYATGAILFLTDHGFGKANNQQRRIGFLLAYEYKAVELGGKKRSGAEKAALTRIGKEWEKKTQELDQEFETITASQHEWRETFQSESQIWNDERKKQFDEILDTASNKSEDQFAAIEHRREELEKTYRDLLKLKEPAQYWETRAKTLRQIGYGWVMGLVLASIMMISTLTNILLQKEIPLLGSLLSENGAIHVDSLRGLLILLTIISFGAYLIRTFAKFTFSSFHLARDAEERYHLTMVYLALKKDSNVEEKDRQIILQSLFSRAETGLIGADGGPTMPGNPVLNKVTGE